MGKHLQRLAVLLLAAALVVSACSRGSRSDQEGGAGQENQGGQAEVKRGPNGEVYGGTYRIAIGQEPAGMDPQVDTTLQVYTLSRNIFNTLLRYKGNTLELEPELLAEMPAAEPDGRTYHFRLREDVTFSNGQKLTAKDVKYTFERMLTPATKAKNTWVLIEIEGAQEMLDGKATELAGFKLTGEYTFDITLKRPFGPFLANLATPPASIFPEEYTRLKGEQFQREPIGSGPFVLKEWQPNQLIVLERNPNYFEKGYPFLDRVEYRVIAEEATRWLEFQNGTFDVSDVPDAERETVLTSGRFTVLESVPLNTYYLALNLAKFPDKRVRQAVSLAIDRNKILQTVLAGQGTVARSFVTPGIPGALTDAPGFEYNPDKARQLLKEAGAEGLKIESWQRGGDKVSDVNLAIQQMLKDVGIDYEVNIVDNGTFRDARANGEIPANYGNWWADYPDPDNYLYTFFHGASGSSRSMSINMNDAAVDAILEEARALPDQAKRQQMYQDLERKLLYEEYAIIPLFHLKSYTLTQKNLHGLFEHPTGVGGAKMVWKDAGSH